MKMFNRIICYLTVLSCFIGLAPVYAAEVDDESIAVVDFSQSEMKRLTAKMGNGDAVIVERDGRKGWQLSGESNNLADSSIYIELDDSFAGSVTDGNVFEVEVDYYDEGSSLFNLLYNSWDKNSYFAGTVVAESAGAFGSKTSIKQWKTAAFRIQDGKFLGNKTLPDIAISANARNTNTLQDNTINEFGTTYNKYYLETYGRTSTEDPIVIGAIRIKKLENKNPFDVKIEFDFDSYAIFDNEPVKLNCTVKNVQEKAYSAQAKYEITDDKGNVIKVLDETFDIDASQTKDFRVDMGSIDKYGELNVRATFTSDGVENVTEVPFAHCREAKEANERLGANVHFEGSNRYPQDFDGEYRLLKKAGYSSIRDSVRWGDVAASGTPSLTPMLRKEMEYQKKYGLDFSPAVNIDELVTGERSSPETLEKFKEYCAWLSNEYKGYCEYFESDNEWNLHMDSVLTDYINLIKATYEGLKKGNPDAKVMGGDWAGYLMKDFRMMGETGCFDYMDAFSYHYYYPTKGSADSSVFPQGEAIKQLFKEFNRPDMPLFLTEYGWSDCFANAITREDVAQWTAQTILQNAAWKTYDRIYPYEFANSGEQKRYNESCFGDIESPYSTYPSKPKPSYIATAMANWALSGTEYEDALEGLEPASGLYVYKYKRKNDDGLGNDMIALWTINDRDELGLKLGANNCKVYDMYGNECDLQAVNGVFSFALTYRPIYLIGDFDTFTKVASQVKITGLTLNGATDDTVIQNIELSGAEDAKIVPLDESKFEVIENNDIKNGKSRIVLKTPSKSVFNSRSEYDIVKDGKVLYHGDIRINSVETLLIDVSHKMVDSKSPNRWMLEISVTNNRNSSNVSGILDIKEPASFAKMMSGSFTDLAPQETKTFKYFMPEILSKEMRLFDVDVKLKSGETLNSTKRLFFTVVPYADTKPVVDGKADKDEYSSDTWFDIKAGEPTSQYNKEMYESLYNSGKMHLGDEDLSAKATMKYDEESVWFFIDVTDDKFVNNEVDAMIWNGDGIQIGITDENIARGSKYCELTVALTHEGPQVYRHKTNNSSNPIGIVTDCEVAIVRDGNHTKYEIRLPWNQVLIEPEKVKAGYKPKFAFLINEDDGLGRNSYMEYSQSLGAIGTYKDVAMFSDMTLAR